MYICLGNLKSKQPSRCQQQRHLPRPTVARNHPSASIITRQKKHQNNLNNTSIYVYILGASSVFYISYCYIYIQKGHFKIMSVIYYWLILSFTMISAAYEVKYLQEHLQHHLIEKHHYLFIRNLVRWFKINNKQHWPLFERYYTAVYKKNRRHEESRALQREAFIKAGLLPASM